MGEMRRAENRSSTFRMIAGGQWKAGNVCRAISTERCREMEKFYSRGKAKGGRKTERSNGVWGIISRSSSFRLGNEKVFGTAKRRFSAFVHLVGEGARIAFGDRATPSPYRPWR